MKSEAKNCMSLGDDCNLGGLGGCSIEIRQRELRGAD